jgi:hypothetical protein
VIGYLGEMIGEIVWRRRPMGSHDQAVHNMLLGRGRFGSPTIVPNGHGRVLTMGKMRTYEMDPDGTLLNADGSIPAVVHQWDRHVQIAARIVPPARAGV